jgi:hypothetical protein
MTDLRRPKPAYHSRNGFTESTTNSAKISTISEFSRLAEEAKKRRLAEWVLKEKGSYFPTYVDSHHLGLLRYISIHLTGLRQSGGDEKNQH